MRSRLEDSLEGLSFSKNWQSLSAEDCVIISYPDDEGVKNNGGRLGAAKGPEAILKYLKRMPKRAFSGRIFLWEEKLSASSIEGRHQEARDWVSALQEKSARVTSLGGGHDYAYPDIAALWKKQKIPVVNIDAHLDMRPAIPGKINSGTAFRRLAEEFKDSPLIQWGIQWAVNSREHLQYCREKKVPIYSYDAVASLPSGPMGFSICLDAFQGLRAVSAPCFVGLEANQVMKVFEERLFDIAWLGLYEVAPQWDPQTEDAARLAAQFAYRWILRESFRDESHFLQSDRFH